MFFNLWFIDNVALKNFNYDPKFDKRRIKLVNLL